MTLSTNQQTALQTLAGRALTTAEITLANGRNDQSLAASLSVGLTQDVPTYVGVLTILENLGLTVGNALIAYITAQSQFQYVLPALNSERLNLASPLLQQSLTAIAASGAVTGFTTALATQLIALCQVSAPISISQVSAILNGS